MTIETPEIKNACLSTSICDHINQQGIIINYFVDAFKMSRQFHFTQSDSPFDMLCAMAVYNVKLIGPDGTENEFEAPDDTCILDAAENAGVEMPNLCRSGACSCCLGQLASGSVDQSNQSLLDEQQIGMGYVLPCVSYPKSDCVIYTHKESDF
ncbi:hypothetical protein RIF29_22431 [Crotalaria pallida]|uniref:Ferredoxin n=1 Tax=Crotalaria pallida TaxID=3830 RepID=A0AAN9F4L4_CROPI